MCFELDNKIIDIIVYHRLRPRMNCRAFCMRGAFLGLMKLEVETGAELTGLTPPLRTFGAAARDATRAAGLADAANAVPCCA